MLKILKASAGSGKTYNLAREYIRLIVGEDRPDAYRHVLAVTFTNKATDEMKRRILQELHLLASKPASSPYFEYLAKELKMDGPTLQKRAQRQLSGILHDYSAFAVSTIDRFFQQTLRAFSREIGQFATYQVQLDREALVAESVDRVLDQLTEADQALLEWLTRSVRSDLDQAGRFSLEGRLLEMARSLQKLPGQATFPRESLETLNRDCRALETDFITKVQDAARVALQTLQECGVDPADSNRGFLKGLYAYTDLPKGNPVKKPTASFLDKAPDPDKWFAKTKAALRQKVEGALEAPLQAFLALFDAPYRLYGTARLIRDQVYGLGMAGELRQAFVQLQREKNVLSLDDSNTILKGIIDGTDTPFIYEKLGVRFDHFLLDEFQDTSDIQWENFRPLLHGSIDSGQRSLVVGDIKQSIYRWRGSDWNLLGHGLEREFSQKEVQTLGGNHRTCAAIVHFNNAFFAHAASRLDALLGLDPAAPDSLTSLYADVEQEVCVSDPAPGEVEVVFTQDQTAEILQTLEALRRRGAEWADIAILVRDNAEGAAIAATLVGEQIPVVSDDALYVKASPTVRRLVSQLSLCDTPASGDKPSVAGFLSGSLDVHIPEHYHSLTDLAEGLLRDLRTADPASFQAEIPYIQSFMVYLQEWVSTGGNNLSAFLKAWADAAPKISAPAAGNAVRVMTVHKAKGLEFPYVIFPFAEKVTLYKHGRAWCRPAVEGTPLEQQAGGHFYVDLTEGSADTLFRDDYIRERHLQAVDNINVFYVALTRARCGLKIIAREPGDGTPKDLSQILYEFTGTPYYSAGEPYDFSRLDRSRKGPALLESGFPSYPADSGRRLRFSPEAADYFGPDGSFGPEASHRIRGNVMHAILSRVRLPEDLPAAVDAAVSAGELPAALREDTLRGLSARLDSVRERGWFCPGVRILNEAGILSPDGNEYRPDRVVVRPDGSVDVIDFKFGRPEEKYRFQVQRYVSLYRQMGYQKVAGYLWYLEDNLIIFAGR